MDQARLQQVHEQLRDAAARWQLHPGKKPMPSRMTAIHKMEAEVMFCIANVVLSANLKQARHLARELPADAIAALPDSFFGLLMDEGIAWEQ